MKQTGNVYSIPPTKQHETPVAVKVGISANPWSRRVDLQTASPFRLNLACQFHCPSRAMALMVESDFHERFAEHRRVGEWFDFDVVEAVAGICDYFFAAERHMPAETIGTVRNLVGYDKIADDFIPGHRVNQ